MYGALHHSIWLVLRACDRRLLSLRPVEVSPVATRISVEDPFTVIDFGVADVRCLKAQRRQNSGYLNLWEAHTRILAALSVGIKERGLTR